MPLQKPRLKVVWRNNNGLSGQGNIHCDGDRRARRQQQSEEVWALAMTLLPDGSWTKQTGPGGRPHVIDSHGRAGPDVSVSHSGEWHAAAAVTDGRVGIDVEAEGSARDWLAIARAFLSPEEICAVARDGEAAFLAFWTLREAVAKMGAGGLAAALALDGAGIVAGRDGWCRADGWVAAHRRLDSAHLAVAWTPASLTHDAERTLGKILDQALIDCHDT